jgi:transcriptional regulator
MYRPSHFREDDRGILHDFIAARGFGLLVSATPEGPLADTAPFLLDRSASPHGVLRAHLARANPHVAALRAGGPVLVVFQGVDGYVSPGWYPTKADGGKVVPTWNYEIVEAAGHARLIDDPAWIARQIADLTDRREAGRADPWRVTDAPADFIAMQTRAIIGVEIVVERLEGKFKMSQNRSAADRAGVRDGLRAEGRADLALRVAARDPAMRATHDD